MARESKPWFRASKNTWYFTLNGRKRSLGVRGVANENEAITAWHRLMGGMPPEAPPAPRKQKTEPDDTEQQKRASCERLERARRFAFSSMVSLAKPFSSCFLRCLVHVSLAPPAANRFLACLIHARKYRLASRFR